VTIVGSRRSTEYGRRAARELARAAVHAGWTVLSGMALGVDGAAHRGALEAGGRTVAVLGSGPDVPAPRSHARLMEEILESGAVLSEYPPGTQPRPHHFPRRNRILAALAHRLVVVEAAERSGALITAREALELGREVWAVPGSIFSPGSPGTHALIRDGAVPVVSVGEWVETLGEGLPGGTLPETIPAGVDGGQLPLGLGGEGLTARLLEAFGGAPRTVETLLARVDAEPALVLAALARLELGGWVERAGPDRYRRRAA
jgi:DNA processing protein